MDVVRRFNRTLTQRIGTLQSGYLARDRSLGTSRVLWEMGAEGRDVRNLRASLDLDSGCLSRLLRSLERAGLAKTQADPEDGRVRAVRLTPAGIAERAALDDENNTLAWSLIEPLNQAQRARLLEAMTTVERRLLTAGLVDIQIEDPGSADARQCIEAYFATLRECFDTGFDPAVSIRADEADLALPAGLFLVARLNGSPIGCGR